MSQSGRAVTEEKRTRATPRWIYLAAPYSDPDPAVIQQRMEIYSRVDAHLIRQGWYTMSPLSKHWILQYEQLPGDWAFWQGYGTAMLAKCEAIAVICMPGWAQSVGVQAELDLARQLNLEIIYLDEQGQPIMTQEQTHEIS